MATTYENSIDKKIIETLNFNNDGLLDIESADKQLMDNGIDHGYDSILEYLQDCDGSIEDQHFKFMVKIMLDSSAGEDKLRRATKLTENLTLEDIQELISLLTFDDNGYISVEKANQSLKDKGHDLFGGNSIEDLFLDGNQLVYFINTKESKKKVEISLIETNDSHMLQQVITEMNHVPPFDTENARKELRAILSSSPDSKMLLSNLGPALKDRGISFSKSFTLGMFISKNPDLAVREMIDNREYCVLVTPPAQQISKTATRYSLNRAIAIGERKIFYSALSKIAQEDETWFIVEDGGDPYRFLAYRMELAFANAIRKQDTNILQSDFFKGTFDTGLTANDNKKILLSFSRNYYPDAEHPQPWIFEDFKLV